LGHDAAKCLIGKEYSGTSARSQIDDNLSTLGTDKREHIPTTFSVTQMIRPTASWDGHCRPQQLAHLLQRDQVTGTSERDRVKGTSKRHEA
jgi:hypothetical protein